VLSVLHRLVSLPDEPPGLSAAVLEQMRRAGASVDVLSLADETGLKQRVRRLAGAAKCGRPVVLVGVGLAGTLLLSMAAGVPASSSWAVLAVFPFLGLDAPPYQLQRRHVGGADVVLRVCRYLPRWRALMRLPVRPSPRGLEGVCDRVSWPSLAGCTPSCAFSSLVMPLPRRVAVVLNTASPGFRDGPSQAVLRVMNRNLRIFTAHPAGEDLGRQWAGWIRLTQRWVWHG
jgi:hypothetical protein